VHSRVEAAVIAVEQGLRQNSNALHTTTDHNMMTRPVNRK